MKLSIGMMVKNESRYLERCLQSLQPLRDAIESELIIVDTGSTDSTVEIAKRFTDKVYFHPWNDNFSAMRNITINYAGGEWFLVIDGDEILENADQIIAFLKSDVEKKYNAASVYVKNFTDETNWTKFSLIISARLFRKNDDFSYEGTVHNQPIFSGESIRINSVILHYGYLATDKELMERKFERTKSILERELAVDSENLYYLYQLSVTYGMHKEFEKALIPIKKAYDIIKNKQLDFKRHMYIFTSMAMFYQNLRQVKEVEEICREGLSFGIDYLDLYFLLGESLFNQDRSSEALEYYEKYIGMVEKYHSISKDPSVIDYTLCHIDDVYNKVCVILYGKGELKKALEIVLKVTNERVAINTFKRVIDLHIELKLYDGLAQYYEHVVLKRYPNQRFVFEEDIEFMRQYWSGEEEECIARSFAKTNSEYGYWHYIWLVNRDKKDWKHLKVTIDFDNKIDIYGEFLYYFLANPKTYKQLVGALSSTNEAKWNQITSYAHKKFDEKFVQKLVAFVRKSNFKSVFELSLARTFSRYALLFLLQKPELRNEMLNAYLKYGCLFIEKMYRVEILNQGKCDWLANDEDLFFIMTWRAKQLLKKNEEQKFIELTEKILTKAPQLRNWCNFLEWKQALKET